MRSIYKYVAQAGFTAAMCIFMAVPTMAQRGGHSGGGGGGFHGGGGGGFSGGGFSRPSMAPRTSFAPRTNFSPRAGFNNRTSVTGRPSVGSHTFSTPGATGYRGYVPGAAGAGVYGHGGRYGAYGWHDHGGYFYNHGWYGTLYYPWIGLSFGYLPYGYYPFWWGGAEFYYANGLFYQYDNDQYTVVEPPIGAAVNKLPSGAQPITINGEQYYEKNGVYYLPVTKDNGKVVYQVAGKDGVLNTDGSGADAVIPHVGDLVYELPPDCRKVKLNGEKYYVSVDGIYYQKTKDSNGKKAYKIVALDDDKQDQQ